MILASERRLGVLVHDRASGAPVVGVPLIGVAEFERLVGTVILVEGDGTATPEPPSAEPAQEADTRGIRVPLGMLATDHAGYASFALGRLGLKPELGLREALKDKQLAHLWIGTLRDGIEWRDALETGLVAPDAVYLPIEVSDPGRLARRADLPAMQEPGLTDWRLSPGSFAVNPALLVGDGDCASLTPSQFATREYHFGQLVRVRDDTHATEQGQHPPVACFFDEYTVAWYPIGHGLGQVAYSLPLAPCESVNLAFIDWSRADDAARHEDTKVEEQLQHNLHRDRAIDETMNASLSEWQRGGSVMGGVGATIPISVVTVSGAVGGGYTTSSGDRTVSAKTAQELSDNVAQATNVARRFESTVIVHAKQKESEAIQTRTVANHNHCHALTILYYEVLRHFRVETRWTSHRPVLLVPYALYDFSEKNTAREQTVLDHRRTIEAALLDPSLRPCLDAVEKLACKRLGLGETPKHAELANRFLGLFEVTTTTGDEATKALPHVLLQLRHGGELPCTVWGPPAEPVIVGGGLVKPSLETSPHALPSSTALGGGKTLRGPRDVGAFVLSPDKPVKWGDVAGVVIRLHSQDPDNPATKISYDPGPGSWRITHLRIATEQGSDLFVLYDHDVPAEAQLIAPDDFGSFEVDPLGASAAEAALSEDERCCIDRLYKHLAANRVHYSRAIWLAEDPDARSIRFGSLTIEGHPEPVIDLIENRPLAVLGDKVAFPTLGDATPRLDGRPADVVAERLASVPARGVFAEAKLGHCNAAEEIDNTRFWDWQQSPCPEKPTAIEPIKAVTPAPHATDVTPSTLPASVVSIVNPPAVPDPTAMASALALLSRPDIFRDMSAQKEVSDLLQKLAGGTMSATQAQAAAQHALGTMASGGSSGVGGGTGGSARTGPIPASDQHDQLQVLRNAEQHGEISSDEHKDLARSFLESATQLQPTAGAEQGFVSAKGFTGVWLPFATLGIDVSHWQGIITWRDVADWRHWERGQPIEFAFIKATHGETGEDSTFKDNWPKCRGESMASVSRHQILRGPYHWFTRGAAGTGKLQAKHFYETVKAHGGFLDEDLSPAVDFEDEELRKMLGSMGTRGDSLCAELKACLEEIATLFGRVPIIYTGAPFWNSVIGANTTTSSSTSEKLKMASQNTKENATFYGYPLWLARYDNPPCPVDPDKSKKENDAACATFQAGNDYPKSLDPKAPTPFPQPFTMSPPRTKATPPQLPLFTSTWEFWQFRIAPGGKVSDGVKWTEITGINSNIDLDACGGTLSDLRGFTNIPVK